MATVRHRLTKRPRSRQGDEAVGRRGAGPPCWSQTHRRADPCCVSSRFEMRRGTACHAAHMSSQSWDDQDTNESPTRQSWQPKLRRPLMWFFALLSVIWGALAVAWVVINSPGPSNYVLLALYIGMCILFAVGVWLLSKSRVEATGDGLHVITALRRQTYRWSDIVEVRPGLSKRTKSWIAVVDRSGAEVFLPLGVEHLLALRQWNARSTK